MSAVGARLMRKDFFRPVKADRRYLVDYRRCDTPEKASWRSNADSSLFQCFGCEAHCGGTTAPVSPQEQMDMFLHETLQQ